ncbi:MAG: M14 family metallopeptidase [Planctomycetota bacterium]
MSVVRTSAPRRRNPGRVFATWPCQGALRFSRRILAGYAGSMTYALACLAALPLFAAPQSPPPDPAPPRTRAERSDWHETSRNADVDAFLDALAQLPHGGRLRVENLGRTVQGRPLRVVRVREPHASPRLRALLLADIHGGEVEGKEAVQILLREIALGEHSALLDAVELAVVPVFNADGNDEIDRGNRFEQNGPDAGVGRRHNSQDRDLNRDFIKLESPEARALLRLLASFDPHLFMDLHTTNGSYHGYHLTYCTSLNGNVDPDIAALMHERFLPAVRQRMREAHGYRIFDYGNFGRQGPESGWTTFSADPRLAINYVGLRHCLSLLSEAYSYLPFEDRAKVTRAFVLESLTELVQRADEVLELRAIAVERGASMPFRFAHELAPPVQGELLVGAVDEQEVPGLGKRLCVRPEFHAVQAPLQVRFVAKKERPLPKAWAILGAHDLVANIVRAHGIDVFTTTEPLEAPAQRFVPEGVRRQGRPFQGHRLVQLTGKLSEEAASLPAGTLVVGADHALARLAAQLLEADSDDGLATWGYFDRDLDAGSYPVLRLDRAPSPRSLRAMIGSDAVFPTLVPYLPGADADETVARLELSVVEPGTRVPPRGFEPDVRFAGRKLRYRLQGATSEDLEHMETDATDRRRSGELGTSVLVTRRAGVTHAELVQACEALRRAGVTEVLLSPPE